MTEDFEFGTDGPALILVGVDGSRTSLRAAAYAAGLARRQRCQLVAIYVKKTPAAAGVSASAGAALTATVNEVEDELRQLIADHAPELGIDIRLETREGEPYGEIVRAADEFRVDAVVVGASESAGHRIVGSLAGKLVRSGRWPVTVVP